MLNSHLHNLRPGALMLLVNQQLPKCSVESITWLGDFRKKIAGSYDYIDINDDGLHIVLNEQSIYDDLPEGVFHQPKVGINKSWKEFVSEHKRYKKEALLARKFFEPFDYFILLAKKKGYLLEESLACNDMLGRAVELQVWDIHHLKDYKHIIPLLELLKQVAAQGCQLELIISFFRTILSGKVSGATRYQESLYEFDDRLNNSSLGWDSCLLSNQCEQIVVWQLIIQYDSVDAMSELMLDDYWEKVLAIVENRCLPLDVQFIVDVSVSHANAKLEDVYLGAYSI